MNRVELPNGNILVHKQNTILPIISCHIFIPMGSVYEAKDNAGITHLAQTLILKGTKKRSAKQIAEEIESIGAIIGADSGEDFSEIFLQVTTKNLNKAIEILEDIIFNSTFPENELEKERQVTLTAIKSREDHIFNVAIDLLDNELYQEHPYSWPEIGTIESVAKISRADIIQWYNEHCGNFIITIVGDISFDKAKKYATKLAIKTKPVTKKITPQVKLLKSNKIIEQKKKFEQAYLMLGFLAPSINNTDYAALKLLINYLGNRMSGKLFIELREKGGLAYEVNTFYPSRKEASKFVIYMGLDKTNIEKAQEKFFEIIEGLKKEYIPEKELIDSKNYLRGNFLRDHETNSRQAWYLGFWEILGRGYEYDIEYLHEIDKITTDDILGTANRLFSGNYVLVKIIPEK